VNYCTGCGRTTDLGQALLCASCFDAWADAAREEHRASDDANPLMEDS
jgi:hypothetical protein